MSFNNLTWPQAALCIALLACTVAAYKLFGEAPAGVLLVLSSVTNLLLGRDSSPESPK